jgi:hypothetical protein
VSQRDCLTWSYFDINYEILVLGHIYFIIGDNAELKSTVRLLILKIKTKVIRTSYLTLSQHSFNNQDKPGLAKLCIAYFSMKRLTVLPLNILDVVLLVKDY